MQSRENESRFHYFCCVVPISSIVDVPLQLWHQTSTNKRAVDSVAVDKMPTGNKEICNSLAPKRIC